MLRQIIVDYLVKQTGVEPSQFDNPNLKLSELGLDSLGVAEMLFEVEDRFGFQIKDPMRFDSMTFDQVLADMEQAIRAKHGGEIPNVKV